MVGQRFFIFVYSRFTAQKIDGLRIFDTKFHHCYLGDLAHAHMSRSGQVATGKLYWLGPQEQESPVDSPAAKQLRPVD